MRARLSSDFIRFVVVSVLGLTVDLSLAWTLSVLVGLSLPVAAACGFLAGAALNYVLHHVWTFRGNEVARPEGAHATRLLRYAVGLGLTLLARLAAVSALQHFVFAGKGEELPTLVTGVMVSFIVNYLVSKYFVFRPSVASDRTTTADLN